MYLSNGYSEVNKKYEVVKSELGEKTDENVILRSEINRLEKEITRLKDSIGVLNTQIDRLERTISEQKDLIGKLRGKIERREKKVAALKKEIARLAQQSKVDWEKINRLEQEKIELKEALDEYYRKSETAQIRVEKATEQLNTVVEQKNEVAQKRDEMDIVRDIVTNTTVRFRKVALRKNQHSGELQKIKKNDKSWRYTDIEFFLEHPNQALLVGRSFRVKIKDLDHKRTLPLNEDNPKYPDGGKIGKEGEKFVYDGNMVEVTYFNSQKKKSKNYQIQVFLISGDKAFVLKNGKYTIVEDGIVKPVH
ncbi:MAG: hypothetical protein D6714_20180 [Bacteroidetes bacterium]|nr:MAG: hypothetical protein D6714_20180 [Bacteroidota bacterium]